MSEQTAMRPARFLIVDDSRALQAILRRVIAQAGYGRMDVRTASDGEEALRIGLEMQPDLIITDWHMPRMSGIEMLQTIRQLGHLKSKVGFVTAEVDPGMIEQARTNGAVFVLAKPFEDASLIEAVRAAVPPQASTAAPDVATDPVPSALLHAPALQDLLRRELRSADVVVEAGPALTAADMGRHVLLGLLGLARRPIVAVLDSGATCLLGGTGAAMPHDEIVKSMQRQEPQRLMIDRCTALLRAIGQELQPASPLLRASMVAASMKRLQDVNEQAVERCDFMVRHPVFGQGRLSVLKS